VGLLVSGIVDTPTLSVQLDKQAYDVDGVLGTMLIRGEIAVFIDIDRVVRKWEQSHQPTQAALPVRSGKKLLVVDDTEFFQKLVSEYLRSQGHEVKVAGNGRQGLEQLEAETFDLVVCDIEMPVMDGLAFARKARENPRLAGIPLVALTTLNTPESRAAAMDSGFAAYEVKLDRQSLLATVSDLLERGHRPPAANPGGSTHG
jgi:CheY-like chemotaxis protein